MHKSPFLFVHEFHLVPRLYTTGQYISPMMATMFLFVFAMLSALGTGIAYATSDADEEDNTIPDDNCSPPVPWEKDPQYDIVRCANDEYLVDPETGEIESTVNKVNPKPCVDEGGEVPGPDITTCLNPRSLD
jgi:hypothetical protein